ncbi:MAG: helix-turn-helix transcriptional regulator [Ruminococcaceae bacterium]|nr:helix-turn-helix transcriptional regulator [Oscillospiraceae bacterium]
MKKITISDKIKKYRKENNITQEQFGQLLCVSAQAISKWERCECYPDITFLPALAYILGCTVNDFFE